MNLSGKVAVVTGGGRGLGLAYVQALADAGAAVVINDTDRSAADAAAAMVTAAGGQAVAHVAAVGTSAVADALIDRAVSEFGRLDILVTNAGILRDTVLWKMTDEQFDLVLDVHVRGTFTCVRAAAIRFREQGDGGRIICIGSPTGQVGNFGQTNYATAKAAIVGLTLTASLELYKYGITVNAVGPGGMTRLTATAAAGDAFEPDSLDADEYHPMDPAGSSPLVAWLASDEAQHVTGQVIRAIHDKIYLMGGWHEKATISNGGKRWDATTLGARLATDIFHTRAPGLR